MLKRFLNHKKTESQIQKLVKIIRGKMIMMVLENKMISIVSVWRENKEWQIKEDELLQNDK